MAHQSSIQHVQNSAALVTLGLSARDHVRPALKSLHWLLVTYWIQYKVTLLMSTDALSTSETLLSLLAVNQDDTISVRPPT